MTDEALWNESGRGGTILPRPSSPGTASACDSAPPGGGRGDIWRPCISDKTSRGHAACSPSSPTGRLMSSTNVRPGICARPTRQRSSTVSTSQRSALRRRIGMLSRVPLGSAKNGERRLLAFPQVPSKNKTKNEWGPDFFLFPVLKKTQHAQSIQLSRGECGAAVRCGACWCALRRCRLRKSRSISCSCCRLRPFAPVRMASGWLDGLGRVPCAVAPCVQTDAGLVHAGLPTRVHAPSGF